MCIRRNSAAPAITIMRLLAWRESVGSLGERELLESLDLIQSFLVRRAVCRSGSRSYGRVFAILAARIGSAFRGAQALTSCFSTTAEPPPDALRSPLEALKVALLLRPLGHDFPSDNDFGNSLRLDELYHKHVCKFLLDRLQNHGNKEQVDTEKLQIEHILPQNPALRREWTDMLGDGWEDKQNTWLHRLGNLTLTGYNPNIRDFPFREKLNRGFLRSSVGRLNDLIIDRKVWNVEAIERRTNVLAQRALNIWSALRVDDRLLPWITVRQRIDDSAGRTIEDVPMDDSCRVIFDRLRKQILTRLSGVIEIPEGKSISYHRPRYFLEVVPRTGYLSLLLSVPYDEARGEEGRAADLSLWSHIRGAHYKQESRTLLDVSLNEETLRAATNLIQRAWSASELPEQRQTSGD